MSKKNIIKPVFSPARPDGTFGQKERDILEKNKTFFSYNSKYIKTMLQIINGESDISIRLLDWFITNYSEIYQTCYKIKMNGEMRIFYVHEEYKNELISYSKKYFDPFCRKNKVIYRYKDRNGNNAVTFKTATCQLQFFQWAIRYKIIDYVRDKLDIIEKEMAKAIQNNKIKKEAMLSSDYYKNKQNKLSGNEFESTNNTIEEDDNEFMCSTDNSIVIGAKKKKVKKIVKEVKRHKLPRSPKQNITKIHYPMAISFD